MGFWIREENKPFRKSLHTRNLEAATAKARTEYFRLQAELQSGNKIFSKTVKELVDDFIAFKKREAEGGIIKISRVGTIKTVLNKWVSPFLGPGRKLEEIQKTAFNEYYIWRRKQAPSVQDVTLKNERALITSLFTHGTNQGYLRHEQQPVFPKSKLSKAGRRNEVNGDEWEKMYRSYRSWISEAEDEEDRYYRKLICDYITLAMNTGLRPGEMKKLTWGMVTVKEDPDRTYESGKRIYQAIIEVPEDTKTGSRRVIGERGEVFNRIKQYSKNTKKTDLIFSAYDSPEPVPRKHYYNYWHSLMQKAGLHDSDRKLVFYSLRHSYITNKLIDGAHMHHLSRNAGTGSRYIDEHYGHLNLDDIRRELTKSSVLEKKGQIIRRPQ